VSRHSSNGSKHHCITITAHAWGLYRLHWVVYYYYSTCRLRYPRSFSRDTDESGARRFAKRWGCKMPGAAP